jgi:hypothetical protein
MKNMIGFGILMIMIMINIQNLGEGETILNLLFLIIFTICAFGFVHNWRYK